MKRRLSQTVHLAALAGLWLALTGQTPDDATVFYSIVENATNPNQVAELLGPLGPVDVLADGQGRSEYELPGGAVVPAAAGTQPLVYEPLPPLDMPDNPGLLDELASGGVHTDGYNSSTSILPGPRGVNPLACHVQVSDTEQRACTPLLVDRDGLLSSLCINPLGQSELVLFDPDDGFRILARTLVPERSHLIDPAGGWYTRMDATGRPLVPTATQELRAYRAVEEGGDYEWIVDQRWDLSQELPEGISATDVIPSFGGGYWYVSGFAHIGHIDGGSGEGTTVWINDSLDLMVDEYEVVASALAVGPAGAYVLTTGAMYMYDLDATGEPRQRWRWEYEFTGFADGSTPTLHDGGDLVTFSINYPDGTMELIVLRTDPSPLSDVERVVCRMPLFTPGEAALKNTVMAYGRSIVAENNYGGEFYEVGDFAPGIARVDVRADYSGCDLVWENYEVQSQVPPRLSTGDGHVWLYTHRRGEAEDVHAYYLTALDFETGEVASEIFIGSGKRIDNPMLSVDFLEGGVMVAGVRNGLVTLCDSELDEDGRPICSGAAANSTCPPEPDGGGCGCSTPGRSEPSPLAPWLGLLFVACIALRSHRRRSAGVRGESDSSSLA